MVKQTPWSKYSPQERVKGMEVINKFTNRLFSDTNPSKGILKRLSPRTYKRHELFPHQPIAAQGLMKRGMRTPWRERKECMLAIHEVGTGKTITAILAAAGLLTMPENAQVGTRPTQKILIVCPKSVLQVWYETLLEWTNLNGDGEIHMVAKQTETDRYRVREAKILLTTPDVLVAAWKTFMYQRTGDEVKGVKKELRWANGIDPKNTKRVAEFGGALPQVHPLFEPLVEAKAGEPSYLLAIVDEAHAIGDRTTQKGYVLSKFTRQSVYKLGLTGTPVQAKPDDLASLAQVLDARPPDLQKKHHYTLRGEEDRSLNKRNIKQFHELLVDRVDMSFLNLPDRRVVTLVYDPWVGLNRTATGLLVDPEVVEAHNTLLNETRRVAATPQASAHEARDEDESKWGEVHRKIFEATIRLGQYEFSSVLGINNGAKGFEMDPSLFEKAAASPSQAMILIERVIHDRQKACHPRIAVFCEHVTELKIMQRYLELQGRATGELFFFDSNLSAAARKGMIDKFLSCNKGIFLFSGAGSVGITLCPGCEVLLSIGALPWNPTTIDQAFGRVYRIGQTRPVEIIQFVARRSVTSVKLRLHEDKRNRLGRAAADEDYSYFDDAEENKWRFTQRILTECQPLNQHGNYDMSPERRLELQQLQLAVRRWEVAREQAHANGVPPPPPPKMDSELAAEAQPASRPDAMPLPPVSFPC